jgi:hypothetical protein
MYVKERERAAIMSNVWGIPALKFIPLGGWASRIRASPIYKLSDPDLNL